MQVYLNLDVPEHHATSHMPRAIRDLYYGAKNDDLLSLIKSYGCPHSGGQHKLHFTDERKNVVAWLDLFLERFPNTEPEIKQLKKFIHNAFVYKTGCNSDGDLRLELKCLTRQHGYNGKIIMRPWFWFPEDELEINW